MRVRQGNDFIFLWTIVRNGIPEDLDNAKNIKLHFKNFDRVREVKSFQIVDGNIVRVEVSPEWASRLGAYSLILSYKFENSSYSDGDRKCVVDVLAFNIVPKTSEADDLTEIAKTTDIMIGFFGLSAYEVWLKDNPGSTKEDYYNWLQKPATDAVSLIDDKIEHLDEVIETSTENEAERVTAEQGRRDAELLRVEAEGIRDANEIDRIEAEGIRDSNETDRINAERDRADAEELREQAEVAREEAEELRQTNTNTAIQNAEDATTAANAAAGLANEATEAANTAAGLANEATEAANTAAGLANEAAENANTAAQNADDAREAIQDDLALKADHGYDSAPKTLKAVDEAKVDKTSIVGETGQGETSVMHQKAVTDELGTKASHGYESNPKTLKEVEDDTINTTEKPTAQSLSELNARITALEAIITNKIKDKIEVSKEFNVWGKTNLILTGSGAATFAPDFIGQKYIDTTNSNVYIAVGVSNAGNWKLV
jgi:hypothetical protein